MTERLYYTDPYLAEFDAQVVDVRSIEGRTAVVLERTAFYPTSGGQPFDVGTLGDARVVEVIDAEDGTVLHVVEGTAPGGAVKGRVDWARRFEHMQQHTGQHVLSAAFDHLFGVRTVSFHLGTVTATIDLAREVTTQEIARAEEEANRIVWEDRPVHIRFADAAEAAKLPLRKESLREGTLRLIDVENFDLSACGGTHVRRTGAIGIIAVAGVEKIRGGSRIEFVCGGRALNRFRLLRDAMSAAAKLISVGPAELPASIDRMQSEAKELKRRVKDLQTRVAAIEAAELSERAEEALGSRRVIAALDGWDASGIKTIASHIVSGAGRVAVLFSTPAPSAVVVARSADVAVDANAVLKKLTERFGGKGGGKPDLAQGGGLQGSPEEIRDFARTLL